MFKIATNEDIDVIYNLNTELFIVLNNLKSDIFNPIAFPKMYISSVINSKNKDYILIEDDEKVIGYVLVEARRAPCEVYENFQKDEFAYIEEIVVLPEYRSKGYGSKLMQAAEDWAKQHKLTRLELNVLSNNYSALAFYEKSGFEEYQIKLRKDI